MSQLALQNSPGTTDAAQRQQQQQQQQPQPQQQRPPPRLQERSFYSQPTSLPASPSSPTLSASAGFGSASSTPSSPVSYSRPNPYLYSASTAADRSPIHSQPSATGSSAYLQNSARSSTPLSSRSSRKPPPSPLHASTTFSFSPDNASPSSFNFPFPQTPSSPRDTGSTREPVDIPQIITTSPGSPHSLRDLSAGPAKTYFNSDSSGTSTPVETSPSPGPSALPRSPNDSRSFSDPVVTSKPLSGSTISSRSIMAGSSATPRAKAAPRNSSIDSGVSALSNSSASRKPSDGSTTHDIPSIIKAAGSPEAVIEHLLKEKQAQVQQNTQLWRLVDKQRAMILGLNKDLERALKDKEKYRKKLKELASDQSRPPPVPSVPASSASQPQLQRQLQGSRDAAAPGKIAVTVPSVVAKSRVVPGNDPSSPVASLQDSPSQSPLQSPINMTIAPYPITPPADQPGYGPPSAVADILNPVESIPRPQDHALDNFDHEAEDRKADQARKAADAAKDLPISLSLPPSRSLPSKPPQVPPPRIPPPAAPMSSSIVTVSPEDGHVQFPQPLAPPPRKPPPAPLQLRDPRPSPTIPIDDEALESDSDYDSLLDVTEVPETEKRGRRLTREEDDREREILALKEAEIRSLSKKSKKGGSARGGTPGDAQTSASPPVTQTVLVPASLDGVLSNNASRSFATPLASPGLPASPRPMVLPPSSSPPVSPRLAVNMGGAAGMAPLSPRPPRQPIPLPPNTPLQIAPLGPAPQGPVPPPPAGAAPREAFELPSPKPLNITRIATDLAGSVPSSPSIKSVNSRESPIERTRIFKGFVTEEYPDLLLPPNVLPSIDIRVASSRMKPSRASLISLTQLEEDPVFTLAILARADGGELWRVEKDSVSLAKLDQRLKQCASFTAKTPDRSLFSGHAPARLDARRQALNAYMDELVNTPLDTPTALELCRYLSTNTLPPNADETGHSSTDSRREGGKATSQKTGAGGRPLKSGYLTKRGKNFGGWKARFFVLDGPRLKYFETPGGAHLGTIKLQNAQIGKQSQQNENSPPARAGTSASDDFDNQYRHAFLILEPKKKDPSALTKHVLCAESDQERDQWVDTLLRWIDYRDPEDEDDVPAPTASSKKATDRKQQGSIDSGRSAGSSTPKTAKKKPHSAGKKHHRHPQQSSQSSQMQLSDVKDALIGVSYEAMQQGELPQGAPGLRQPSNDVEPPQTVSAQSPYTISAPRDPQVISDSSTWGNRTLPSGSISSSVGSNLGGGLGGSMSGGLGGGLALPTTDEKKVRKRSFFGFGPKTRSSGDGPSDSLFGENGASANGGAGANGAAYAGQNHQVFGAPLAEAVRYNSPVDVKVPLPAVVYRCIQYLDAHNALMEEGIFRLSGSNVIIKQLRERFNVESDVNLLTDPNYYDIHAVASLLKMYLRELPTTILTRDLHMQFLSVTEIPNQDEKLAALNELAQRLPQANGTLLKYLISFLIKIINHAEHNKMTVRNVGIVFSPTLNIPAPVFALLLQNYEAIFGIAAEEYELPSSDGRSLSSVSTGATVDLPLQRPPPATQAASESPHRQRLLEAVKVGSAGGRGTPTPPPALLNASMPQFSQLRSSSTPTPPPTQPLPMQPSQQQHHQQQQQQQQQQQRMTIFDPQYLAQQQGGSQVSLRPAYESGFVMPQGYDPMQMAGSTAARGSPSYDRPIYNTNGAGMVSYEGAYGGMKGGSNRRESAILPGGPTIGLNVQNSRSRLREDTRY